MKERPILFKGEMVKAVLDGSKTQTRRIIKLTNIKRNPDNDKWYKDKIWSWRVKNGLWTDHTEEGLLQKCPFGQIGDRLWVRETYHPLDNKGAALYRADGQCEVAKWTPSIHMFREYSRINLEIINVRVERLREITEADARSEGVGLTNFDNTKKMVTFNNFKNAFMHLWDLIYSKNGCGSENNPWVWAVEFKVVK